MKNAETKQIPLVLPLVVYHGQKHWPYSTDIREMVDAPAHLTAKYFLKPFILIDLNNIDDEILKQHTWAGVMSLALKHIFARDILPHVRDIIELLKYLEQRGGENFAETVLIYILDRGELHDKKVFIEMVKAELAPEIGEKMMTIAEQFRAEGIQQGMQQGKIQVAKHLIEKKAELSFIAEVTGLSLATLISLQESFA